MSAGDQPVFYIRFVVKQLDPDSGRRQGMFQAAGTLERSGVLSPKEQDALDAIYKWFRENLKVPDRLAISPRPHRKKQAISWFKSTASAHIQKMQEYRRLIESHGVGVEMIKTDRPGYIVYEDEHQVAAYPFADTKT